MRERRVSGCSVLDRRTFLKVSGLTGAALLGASMGGPGSWAGPGTAAAATPSAGSASIANLVELLEYDIERMFDFVAREIRYQPYTGILRGADGTLIGREGNSADQALLLGALLTAAVVPFRYATGPIDDATARALMAGTVVDRTTAAEDTLTAITGSGLGGDPLVAPPIDQATRDALEASLGKTDEVLAWARDQVSGTVGMIQSALAAAGAAPAFTSMPDRERQQHVWVQVASGSAWTDLDPTMADAGVGDSFSEAATVSDTLPDDLRHRVAFAVITETLAGGALATQTILNVERDAATLAGETIAFVNVQPDTLKGLGAKVTSGLAGRTSYLPCLAIGDDVFVGGKPISFGGTGGPLDVASPGVPLDGEATAQWLEVTIQSPDADPVVVRREVFDRVGPGTRASGTFVANSLAPATFVELVPGEPMQYVPAQTRHVLTVSTGVQGGAQLGRLLSPADDVAGYASAVHAFHLVREAAAQVLAVPLGVRTFLDAPNVTSLTFTLDHDAVAGLTASPVLDIWHRSYGVGGVTDVAAGVPPAVVAGVLGHIAERIVFGDALAPTDPADARPASVGAVFDLAKTEGIATRVLRGPDEAADLPFAPDTLARLQAALTPGMLAIVPERPVSLGGRDRVGWWLVDSATGRTVDQMDDGRGAEGDYVIIIRLGSFVEEVSLRPLGLCLFAIFSLSVGILGFVVGAWSGSRGGAQGVLGGLVGGAGGLLARQGGDLLAAGACAV